MQDTISIITVNQERLIQGIIRHRVHIASCAAVSAWAWARLVGNSINGIDIGIIFLYMLCIYEWNRVFDTVEDSINHTGEAVLAYRYKTSIIYLCLLTNVFMLGASVATGRPESVLLLLLVGLLGFFYSTPVSVGDSQLNIRLKNIFILKNLTSGVGWISLVVFYPAIHMGIAIRAGHWLAAGVMLAAVCIVELIWDIRDQEGDKLAGVRSVPVLKGFKRTRRLILLINSLSALGVVVAYNMGWVPAFWLFILLNNLLVFIWISKGESWLTDRGRSHILVGLQTLLLILLGWGAGNLVLLQNLYFN